MTEYYLDNNSLPVVNKHLGSKFKLIAIVKPGQIWYDQYFDNIIVVTKSFPAISYGLPYWYADVAPNPNNPCIECPYWQDEFDKMEYIGDL